MPVIHQSFPVILIHVHRTVWVSGLNVLRLIKAVFTLVVHDLYTTLYELLTLRMESSFFKLLRALT